MPPAGGIGSLQPRAIDGEFTFLNRTENIDWPFQWDRPDLPKLWLYNLHYFDWLWGLDYEQARRDAPNVIVLEALPVPSGTAMA